MKHIHWIPTTAQTTTVFQYLILLDANLIIDIQCMSRVTAPFASSPPLCQCTLLHKCVYDVHFAELSAVTLRTERHTGAWFEVLVGFKVNLNIKCMAFLSELACVFDKTWRREWRDGSAVYIREVGDCQFKDGKTRIYNVPQLGVGDGDEAGVVLLLIGYILKPVESSLPRFLIFITDRRISQSFSFPFVRCYLCEAGSCS